MTMHDDQLNKLNQNHEAIMARMKESYDATKNLISNSSIKADELLKAGKYQESADVMSKMIDGVQAQQKNRWQKYAQNAEAAHKIVETPVTSSREVSKSILPQGISRGKMAAIVAGVAVAAGGVYLYRQHKKRESWTTKIEQERMTASQRGLS